MSFLPIAMTSLGRNLVVLLLFLNPLLLHLFTHAASVPPPATRQRIIYMTDPDAETDEDDGEDHSFRPEVVFPVKTTVLQRRPELCHDNSCLENQEPCHQISSRTGCLCPGISGADQPPHAPRIKGLLPVSEGEHEGSVEVRWCAPLSEVSKYRVVVQGGDRPALEFSSVSRKGLIGSLEPGEKVCVEAVNLVGNSVPSDFSCLRYDPSASSSDHALLNGMIGGGIALLVVLIIIAVILTKYQVCQKAKRDSGDGLGNPSYSTGGTL